MEKGRGEGQGWHAVYKRPTTRQEEGGEGGREGGVPCVASWRGTLMSKHLLSITNEKDCICICVSVGAQAFLLLTIGPHTPSH